MIMAWPWTPTGIGTDGTEDDKPMRQRTITGLLLTALLAVMLWLPGWCMAVAVMICISFAVHE